MPVFGFGYVRLRQQYSDEQNRVAVEHYLNHDRCLAGTIMGTRMSEPSVSAGGLRRTAGGGPISLQHERISELYGQPLLAKLGSDWPAHAHFMRRLLLRFKSRRTLALHGGRPLFSERQTLTRVVRTTQVVACKSYLNVDILVLPFEQLAEDTEFHRVSEGRAKNPVSRPPTNFYRNLVKLLAGDQRMSATVATARNR